VTDAQIAANRALWDELTAIHAQSAFYGVEGFLAGDSSLGAIELEEVGDVAGKRLLHLQCHFGLDTLSWARRGALVTGVDFSGQAIALARQLAAQAGLTATFVEADLHELTGVLRERFDLVFSSWGVLCWLPDLTRWASLIADSLVPGGLFYLLEFHPFLFALNDESEQPLLGADSYFHRAEPHAWENDGSGSYADPTATVAAPIQYEWDHPLGEIVTTLLDAGLKVEWLHEFGSLPMRGVDWPCIAANLDGSFGLRGLRGEFPVAFSLQARRPR
jgi:SAM-dependent methyltransferase